MSNQNMSDVKGQKVESQSGKTLFKIFDHKHKQWTGEENYPCPELYFSVNADGTLVVWNNYQDYFLDDVSRFEVVTDIPEKRLECCGKCGNLPWFSTTEQMPDELMKVLVFKNNDYEIAWREEVEDGMSWQTETGRIFNVNAWCYLHTPNTGGNGC